MTVKGRHHAIDIVLTHGPYVSSGCRVLIRRLCRYEALTVIIEHLCGHWNVVSQDGACVDIELYEQTNKMLARRE